MTPWLVFVVFVLTAWDTWRTRREIDRLEHRLRDLIELKKKTPPPERRPSGFALGLTLATGAGQDLDVLLLELDLPPRRSTTEVETDESVRARCQAALAEGQAYRGGGR